MFVKFILFLTLILLACDTATKPTPLPDFIVSEWGTAQMKLINEGWDTEFNVRRILPEMFSIFPRMGQFYCGDVLANGCFDPPSTIIYNFDTPQVIRHEALHAILYKLKHPGWVCPEHAEKCVIGHDQYEVCKDYPTCKGG